MAIIDYTTLSTEVNEYTERSYLPAKMDTFIGLAEAEFNIYLGPNYVRETSATITTDALGVASLPAGFVRFISMSSSAYGNIELVTWDALTAYNPHGAGGLPSKCAISGTLIKVGHLYGGDFTLNYETTLAGLSGSNATNWLILKAPQAYFWMVMAQAKASEEDWAIAASLEGKARTILNDLGIQSMVAQFGRASLKMRGPTP